jgi:hypothetical protein
MFARSPVGGLSGEQVYNVPDGFVAVVRDLDIYGNNDDPEAAFFFEDGFTNGTIFQWQQTVSSIGSPTWKQWQGRQVFTPPAQMVWRVGATISATFDFRCCGYLLQLP